MNEIYIPALAPRWPQPEQEPQVGQQHGAIEMDPPADPNAGEGCSLRERACAIACCGMTTLGSLAGSGLLAWQAYEWDQTGVNGGGAAASGAAFLWGIVAVVSGSFTARMCLAQCNRARARIAPTVG